MTTAKKGAFTAVTRSQRHMIKLVAVAASAVMGLGVLTATAAMASTAQAKLSIVNKVLKYSDAGGVKLDVTGGSGSGALTFSVNGSGCAVNNVEELLTATKATTCAVTAKKAASGSYAAATSAPVTFTFTAAPVAITNKVLKGEVGVSITVTSNAGSGAFYSTTGSVCSINGATGALLATAVGSCPVTVQKGSTTSAAVTFTFTPGPQPALTISNSPLTGTVGTPVTVLTDGGSGEGAITFAVTGTGCAINASTGSLTDSAAGTCSVIATEAASADYLAGSSPAAVFTFSAGSGGGGGGSSSVDVATLTSVTGAASGQINDTVNGDKDFINQYYNANDHWYEYYIAEGSTVTENWHIVGKNGQPLANSAVTLYSNLNYSTGCGVTWAAPNTSLNSCSHTNGSGQGSLTAMTDANGNVSFTLVDTNTNTVPAAIDLTTTASAEKAEGGTNPYCDTILQVGSDVFTSGNLATITEQTDRVDFILIPTA